MKVGDLVKHKEDEVMGLIVDGPVAVVDGVFQRVCPAEPEGIERYGFVVHWFDLKTPNTESHTVMSVISPAYKKVENNLNTDE